MINEDNTISTTSGEYEVVAHVYEDVGGDEAINLYVGKSTKDGHYDLIAEDNATNWVVGNPDDPEDNYSHFETIGDRYMCARNEIRSIDSELADFIDKMWIQYLLEVSAWKLRKMYPKREEDCVA